MDIRLESATVRNFKGARELDVFFSDRTEIRGRNASGKTTLVDAIFWLLFDKDSQGNSNFHIRTMDENGKDIDNTEISVTGNFTAWGEPLTLTKTQKQKWVKKRGSEERTFEGNVNTFEINGFPAKKSEYDAKIHSLIDENLFRLLTNPRAFASMKWQDQRKILLQMVSEITDDDVLDTDTVRYEPIADDVLAAGADKAKEKATSILRKLREDQKSYPIRIDEAMNGVAATISKEEIGRRRAEIDQELETIQNERNDLMSALKSVTDIQDDIMQTRRKMGELEMAESKKVMQAKQDAVNAYRHAESEVFAISQSIERSERTLATLKSTLADDEAEIKRLAEKYRAVKMMKLSGDETNCPTCGRPFDGDALERIKNEFETSKAGKLAAIAESGTKLRSEIEVAKEKISAVETAIEKGKKEYAEKLEQAEALKAVADSAPSTTSILGSKEYEALSQRIEKLNAVLATMDSGDSRKQALDEREKKVREDERQLAIDIAEAETAKRAKERVAVLQMEQAECGQKVADQERKVYLLEEFMKVKMDMLSEKINSKFSHVRFKLFNTQINGAITETCTMQINSNGSYVDYADANNAAKIVGGLDVIAALMDLYEVSAPIFLDNAEALNSYNIPDMNTQMILLKVDDCEELEVYKY